MSENMHYVNVKLTLEVFYFSAGFSFPKQITAKLKGLSRIIKKSWRVFFFFFLKERRNYLLKELFALVFEV